MLMFVKGPPGRTIGLILSLYSFPCRCACGRSSVLLVLAFHLRFSTLLRGQPRKSTLQLSSHAEHCILGMLAIDGHNSLLMLPFTQH